jgi:hypothetical protein
MKLVFLRKDFPCFEATLKKPLFIIFFGVGGLVYFRNAKLFTDFITKYIVNFTMSWNGSNFIYFGVKINRMVSTFSMKYTTVII